MALSQEEIVALLTAKNKGATGKPPTPLPGPIQLGPLRWAEDTKPCASRGCTSPTMIRVQGIPRCVTHALYALNEIILRELEGVLLDDCNCNAGLYSKGNIHTLDCELVLTHQEAVHDSNG